MMSEAAATLLAALVGGLFALLCVWIGFCLSRLASERERRTEALFTIYQNIEVLRTQLYAFQKNMIDEGRLHRNWSVSDRAWSVLVAPTAPAYFLLFMNTSITFPRAKKTELSSLCHCVLTLPIGHEFSNQLKQ
jgi:hypothetical protein